MTKAESFPVSREEIVEQVARALHEHGTMADGTIEVPTTEDWRDCSHAPIHDTFAHKIADRLMGMYGPREAPTHPWSPQLALAKMGLNANFTVEDGSVTAQLDDAPGIITAGRTEDEALENLLDALGEWIKAMSEGGEGREPVEVRVATTSAIALYGLQRINGCLLGVGDRVLVRGQHVLDENGVYVATEKEWVRADVDAYARVCVAEGTFYADTEWIRVGRLYHRLSTSQPIGPAVFRRDPHDLPTLGELATSMDHQRRADRINDDLDYEDEALDGIRRSWLLDDPACQALALADAQVWATLHLARVTKRGQQ